VSTHYFRFSRRGAVNPNRSSLLERLLARADAPVVIADWRADAFRLIAPQGAAMPGVGAAALFAERGPVDAAAVFIATPVHYVAGMSSVRLPADGILRLPQPEADALTVDFNRVWNDAGVRLIAGRSAGMFCLADRALDATTRDPEDVRDGSIESHLPTGTAAPRLRQLMSEIEMWLFDHEVNRARNGAGAPAVNGLWLWGGGPALETLPPIEGWTRGDDPLFRSFAARPDVDARARSCSGVAVIGAEPGTEEWGGTGQIWLERSLADLTRGRVARLQLSAGSRCFSVSARVNWRLWRRRRPWWESFA
jgi:hypothetical protein